MEADRKVRVVILTGTGERAFCAGADLRQAAQLPRQQEGKAFRDYGRRTLERIETFPRPIIAALHGYCNRRRHGHRLVLRLSHRRRQQHFSRRRRLSRHCAGLPRFVGRNKALDILLIGENFGAHEAYAMDLVSKVVPQRRADAGSRGCGPSHRQRLTARNPRHAQGDRT